MYSCSWGSSSPAGHRNGSAFRGLSESLRERNQGGERPLPALLGESGQFPRQARDRLPNIALLARQPFLNAGSVQFLAVTGYRAIDRDTEHIVQLASR